MHLHTTISDGLLRVEEVVALMASNGFQQISITDHDRLEGNRIAIEVAKRFGICYTTGIEMSTDVNEFIDFDSSDYSIHLLGYGFQLTSLEDEVHKMDLNKINVARKLYERMVMDGYHLPEIPIGAVVTRTKIANYLVQAKYSSSIDEAFESILNLKYGGYRVPKLDSPAVIRMIHEAGGIVIWAHPREIIRGNSKMQINMDQIHSILKILVAYGIDGIEARYA
jgi:3',5'-nucleoside bisphosphate phosphatase